MCSMFVSAIYIGVPEGISRPSVLITADALTVSDFMSHLENDFNLKVWYDAIPIKGGDSIRTKIDKGLKIKIWSGYIITQLNW